jgi:nucleotide-binding universal stress UspA family protein
MVALPRTDADPGLLRYAANVARLGTASEVHFVHVIPYPLPGLVEPDGARIEQEVRAAVRQHFTGVPAAVPLSFEVVPGPLLDRLLTTVADRHADVLFLGHRREHPGQWATARRLAMKAPCSVWMIPDGSKATFDRILAPIDFSDPTADSLRVAVSMAQLVGHAECFALHVYFNEAVATYEGYDQVIRGQEAAEFQKFIAGIDTKAVRISPVFEEGANVAHVIHQVAADRWCDLVVMATRGRSRSASILLGSVTEQAIREAHVPLLVVKHYGAQMGLLRALLEKTRRTGDDHTS